MTNLKRFFHSFGNMKIKDIFQKRFVVKIFYLSLIFGLFLILTNNLQLTSSFQFLSSKDRLLSIPNISTSCLISRVNFLRRIKTFLQLIKPDLCTISSKRFGLLPIDSLLYQIKNNSLSLPSSAQTCDPFLKFTLPTLGGSFVPENCAPADRVLLVIPYRNRSLQLVTFMAFMHPFLQRQNISYQIVVVEQVAGSNFNRGMLMNIGYLEGAKLFDFNCSIFHDVDLIPENDDINYSCTDTPTHMSAAVDTFRYKIPYESIFGGVENFRKNHFREINGFSNKYFGWGGEDDDLYQRVILNKFPFKRLPLGVAKYRMLHHLPAQRENKKVALLLKDAPERIATDGLSDISYELLSIELKPLYIHLKARINQ